MSIVYHNLKNLVIDNVWVHHVTINFLIVQNEQLAL